MRKMDLNGTLMSADREIAQVIHNKVKPLLQSIMPLYFDEEHDSILGWLEQRAVDKHRINARLLKKALRLTTAEDIEVVLKVHGATITDNCWFREAGSNLAYDDVKFKENMFDKLALYGDPDSFNQPESATPELTNIGSFEKCWRLADGKWWLYKQGSDLERFSELFISYFGKTLGFSMAHYELDGEFIKSLDYTEQRVNYEPMYSLVGEDEDYQKSWEALEKICPAAAEDYVKMVFLDAICFNMDRHTKNYGVLRDIQTGDVIGLAPNFDNNIALISRGYPKNMERTNDKLIQFFVDFVSGNGTARKIYEEIDTAAISGDVIKDCIEKTGFSVDENAVCTFIQNGVKLMKNQVLAMGIKMQETKGIELS